MFLCPTSHDTKPVHSLIFLEVSGLKPTKSKFIARPRKMIMGERLLKEWSIFMLLQKLSVKLLTSESHYCLALVLTVDSFIFNIWADLALYSIYYLSLKLTYQFQKLIHHQILI